MRVRTKASMAAAIIVGTLAAQTSGWAQPAPVSSSASSGPDVLAFYPARALASGLEGSAELKCDFTERLAPRNCHAVSQEPSGEGFGEAALKVAASTPDNPKISMAPQTGQIIRYAFTLNPPMIRPAPLEPIHLIVNPDYLTRPNPAEILRAHPELAKGPPGRVSVECIVTVDGRLDACSVIEETPAGHGYGRAALDIVSHYKMKPQTLDGEPRGGVRMRMGFSFGAR